MAIDRRRAFEPDAAETGYDPSAEGYLLPSRSAALQSCRAALAFGPGPLLVSGEAGAGKTWLGRQLAAALPAELRTIAIDATPTTGPAGVFRTLAGSLGLAGDEPRLLVRDYLAERSADGRRLLLVVDEAHVLADAVLDELRILSNRLGQPDGLGGLVLVGQTSLLRRLSGRSLTALANRLSDQVHLQPLDADEACALLAHYWPRRHWRLDEVERLHRDAGGNPQRLLRSAQRFVTCQPPSPVPQETRQAAGGPVVEPHLVREPEPPTRVATATTPTLLGPSRPPLHEEDGLIEVGWEPGLEEGPAGPIRGEPPHAASAGPLPGRQRPNTPEAREETVNDHYAALQAWNEWAQNQGRVPGPPASDPLPGLSAEVSDLAEDELRADGEPARSDQPQFRAEGPGTFAPYSQLFSRLRPSKDAG